MKSKDETDREAVLLTLDQLSQTMDVMSQVVARLKRSVEQADGAQALESRQSQVGDDHGESPQTKATLASRNDEEPVVVH